MKTTVWLLAATAGLAGCSGIEVQGHRGARGLTPENTLAAFEKALEAGVDALEMDSAVTRDGWVVVSHDQVLNPDITRGPDGRFLEAKGPAIKDLTYVELQAYDVGRLNPGTDYAKRFPDQQPVDGARIPRLHDVIELLRRSGHRGVTLNIEVKTDPTKPSETLPPDKAAQALVATLYNESIMPRVIIQSFDWRALEEVRRIAPRIPTAFLTVQGKSLDTIGAGMPEASPWTGRYRYADYGSVPKMVKAAGGMIWSPNANDVTAENVAEAKALNLQVIVWTVNDPASVRKMRELGVNGIITDRPDRVRALLK
jgi:glycerophosphoryl diester phosphodiesterase